jgi:hypothetical protein
MNAQPDAFVFVSHIGEDRAVAAWLRRRIEEDFQGYVSVFVSSDGEGIGAGERWFDVVERRLDACQVLLVLCTQRSVVQPWVNFEFGAAWALDKLVIPVCVGGLTPADLEMPFSEPQAVTLTTATGLEYLYRAIAKRRETPVPRQSFDELLGEIPVSEEAPPTAASPDPDDAQMTRRRLHDAMTRYDGMPWRTLRRVAIEAGLTEEQARKILRADEAVAFGSGTNGVIVGLKARLNRT